MTVMATEGAAAGGITREQLLAAPRSGARPLAGSAGADPAPARHPVAARAAPRTSPGPSPPATAPVRASPAAAAGPGSTATGSSPGPSRPGLPGSGSGRSVIPSGGPKSYHRIVMAEFVLTVILIGLSPVLTPRKGNSAAPQDVAAAVSFAAPLVRLTAACIVFFALALASTGERSGKLAAAFGGLIVLGTLLNATDMFTAIGQAFAPAKGAKASGPDTQAA